ncbi:TldD/PmbA family protein [Roseitalea porphyridii]|uniref:TldD/PmbA family protein n=1 Tax=Roseitalea porphyridii TaxID=1852022 RepID=A0A4V1A3L1_9HYPH|nr:TldD/PmbA family protein [Roseitalea porphyridii]QBK29498.1 TldD/PmbA family protein [Roseitalea porphyridii]
MDDHSQTLLDRASRLVEAARRAGADAADAVSVRSRSRAVSVRNGKVEGTDASESDDMSLRVFVGRKVASVSAAATSDPAQLAERAVAMAKVSPDDPYNGLPDQDRLARDLPDLDLYDATEVSAERLTEDALAAEAAALAVDGITNSSGGSASAGEAGFVLVTTDGFSGAYRRSRFGRSVAVIAGEGTAMERDYEFSSRTHFADLDDPADIGRKAGERTARRINPRKMPTGRIKAVFDPRVARSILGHLSGAINGGSVARRSTFLGGKMGQQIANAAITVIDDPLRPRGAGSRLFDGEGVVAAPLTMVDQGVLNHWFLSTAIGRELELETNGRGVRGGTVVNAGSTNLSIEPGDVSPEQMLDAVGTGFYVTEVFGQGVNLVTGEYSRGASGFWIENGELAFPVSEVTIAGNLADMFMAMQPANDLDRTFPTAAPTLMTEPMTLAGT